MIQAWKALPAAGKQALRQAWQPFWGQEADLNSWSITGSHDQAGAWPDQDIIQGAGRLDRCEGCLGGGGPDACAVGVSADYPARCSACRNILITLSDGEGCRRSLAWTEPVLCGGMQARSMLLIGRNRTSIWRQQVEYAGMVSLYRQRSATSIAAQQRACQAVATIGSSPAWCTS